MFLKTLKDLPIAVYTNRLSDRAHLVFAPLLAGDFSCIRSQKLKSDFYHKLFRHVNHSHAISVLDSNSKNYDLHVLIFKLCNDCDSLHVCRMTFEKTNKLWNNYSTNQSAKLHYELLVGHLL